MELCASEERETWAELEMRHKKETRELEGRTRAMLVPVKEVVIPALTTSTATTLTW